MENHQSERTRMRDRLYTFDEFRLLLFAASIDFLIYQLSHLFSFLRFDIPRLQIHSLIDSS